MFAINSYTLHAQRIMKFDGYFSGWIDGLPEQTFCVGRRAPYQFQPAAETKAFEKPGDSVPVYPIAPTPTITKPPREVTRC